MMPLGHSPSFVDTVSAGLRRLSPRDCEIEETFPSRRVGGAENRFLRKLKCLDWVGKGLSLRAAPWKLKEIGTYGRSPTA